MAGNNLNVIRENLFYAGWSKQANWGTPVAPTTFWRFLQGTQFQSMADVKKEREGDTSPFMSLVWKGSEYFDLTIVEKLRPRTTGCALQAVLGTASDTYTAPAKTSTLSASVIVGATTFSSVADLGNVGASVAHVFSPSFAFQSADPQEVALVNLTTRTGTGPWTYTLVAGTAFKQPHTSADVIQTVATHSFQRQSTTYDPYTIEVGYGANAGTPAGAIRLTDCVCYDVSIDHKAGSHLQLTHKWYGRQAVTNLNTLLTPAYEYGDPFLWHMAGTTWTLDGAGTNNAATVTSYKLDIKNSTSALDLLTEGINPQYFIQGNVDITCNAEVEFTSFDQYYETYFGNTKTPLTGATDNFLTGVGSLLATYTLDGINSFGVNLANAVYTASQLPTPALTGKPMKQKLTMDAYKTAATANPLTLTLTNAQASAY